MLDMLDVWAADVTCLDPHRLIQGRCETWLPRLDTHSVDVVVTSPPYNLGVNYGACTDDLSEEDYLRWFAEVTRSIARVLKPGGSFFLNISGSSTKPWLAFSLPMRIRSLKCPLGEPLFVLQNHITWIKSVAIDGVTRGQFKPINSRRFLNHTHEMLLHFTRDGNVPLDRLAIGVPFADETNIRRFGADGRPNLRCRGNTWFVPYETVQSREEKFGHPAGYPVALPETAILLHGVKDPVVLDPFSGAGTTVVAAHRAGGRGIGIEEDARFHAQAVQRLRAAMAAGDRSAAPDEMVRK